MKKIRKRVQAYIARDNTLDITRGVFAVLMIFAHGHTLNKTVDTAFTLQLWKLGFLAPIGFFIAIGYSVFYQQKKYTVWQQLSFATFLFIIGMFDFGMSGSLHGFWKGPNLFVSLGMCMVMLLVAPKRFALFNAGIIFASSRVLKTVDLSPSLFIHQLFSVIPWAACTFVGYGMASLRKEVQYIISIGFVLLSIGIDAMGQLYFHDQSATLRYFLIGITLYYSVYTSAALIEWVFPWFTRLLAWVGKESLLFYFIHIFLIRLIPQPIFAPNVWAFILLGTMLTIWSLRKLNMILLSKVFSHWLSWQVLFTTMLFVVLAQLPQPLHERILFAGIIVFGLQAKHTLRFDTSQFDHK